MFTVRVPIRFGNGPAARSESFSSRISDRLGTSRVPDVKGMSGSLGHVVCENSWLSAPGLSFFLLSDS